MSSDQSGPPADPQRDAWLRKLHPDQVRRRERRARWLRAALALFVTMALFVWLAAAHQAALQATADSDPALGEMFFIGIFFCLSLGVFVALLGYALICDLRHRGR